MEEKVNQKTRIDNILKIKEFDLKTKIQNNLFFNF